MDFLSVFTEPNKIKAHIDDFSATDRLENHLTSLLVSANHRSLIILCIGTDRSTGDSLGPLIGTHLGRFTLPKLHVWGTLDAPVHATNLEEKLNLITKRFPDPFVIAVDACLGRLDSVGCLILGEGPLKPGAGVHKKLPEVGNAYLTGIVNVGGFMEYMVLQNTRLSLVWKMALTTSNLISRAYLRASCTA